MLNISLPDQVQSFVEEQAKAEGFNLLHEYIYQLILRKQARVAQQKRVEALLLEGLDSKEAIVATDDWWEHKRTELVKHSGCANPIRNTRYQQHFG